MSYYSIDDIETDGIRVPTKFQVDAPGLGFLLPDKLRKRNSPDVYSGAEVMLPLWLATPLASASAEEGNEVPLLEMQEPEALRPDVLNILKSEPGALDLRSQNRLFTNLALVWNELFTGEELSQVLYNAVRIRAAHIFDAAIARHGADQTLDVYETELYQSVSKAVKDMQQWQKKVN